MRTHTQNFKDEIKLYGRQLARQIMTGNYIIYHADNTGSNYFYAEELNSIRYYYDCGLFRTNMQTLVIDSNVELPIGNIVECRLGLKINNSLSTLIFGNFYVNKVEQQKDKKSWLITCYDIMSNTMVDYEGFYNATTDTTFTTDKNYYQLNNGKYKRYTGARTGNPHTLGLYQSAFPMTIKNYILAICNRLNIQTANISNMNGGNWEKQVTSEHYVDVDGNSLGYTYRDVLDDIAEVLSRFIYIEPNDQLTTKRIYQTNNDDTINEDYFSDKNVNIGKKIGPYNIVILSRGNDSDNIHYPATIPSSPNEFKISNNLILEQDNREEFIQAIYERVTGWEFYENDFATTGIMYYELGDCYNVSIDGTTYPCLMLNDDIKMTTGLVENIHTEAPKQSTTDLKYSSYSDKVAITSRNAYIKADKNEGKIELIVEGIGDSSGNVNGASLILAINGDTSTGKLSAGKLNITATDVLNILAGNQINLTSKNITIASNNFSVDANGNLVCSNATITGGSLTIGTKFSVDNQGNLTCSNATINNGTINIENSSGNNSLYTYEDDSLTNTRTETSVFPAGTFTDIRNRSNDNITDFAEYYCIGTTISNGSNIFNATATDLSFYDNNYNTKFQINGTNGKIYYGTGGREDYGVAGFIYDQYGNMQHKRDTSGDNFNIKKYDGTIGIRIYPETAKITSIGDIETSGDYLATKGNVSTNTGYRATRTDTGVNVFFGIGGGGTNRGIYDTSLGKWLFYTDGTDYFINNNKITNLIRDTGWKDATMKSGFTSNALSSSGKLQYRRIGNVVYIKGSLKGFTAISQICTQLPSGYRPPTRHDCYGSESGNYIVKFMINNVGEMTILGGTRGTYTDANQWYAINTSYVTDNDFPS